MNSNWTSMLPKKSMQHREKVTFFKSTDYLSKKVPIGTVTRYRKKYRVTVTPLLPK